MPPLKESGPLPLSPVLLATVPSPISFGADLKGSSPSFLAVVALDFIDPGLSTAFLIIST
jgi:hypothetical protein